MKEVEDAIYKYIDKFGGIPSEYMRSWTDEEILERVTKAIETDTPLKFEYSKDERV